MKTAISKLVAFVLLFAITNIHSFSQSINLDEVSGCLVSDVSGKVTFTEPGNPTPKSVTAGMVLSDDATVVVGKKANFTLVCDDRSLAVNKKGTHKMAMLSKDVQANGVTSRFAKMAFAAKGIATPDTTKVRKGWGGKDSILISQPVIGKIPLQPIKFSWTALKNGTEYRLIMYENNKDLPILSATTSGAHFNFDPANLAVKPGKNYRVQVMLANDNKTASKVVNITFVSPNESETALASLMKDKAYLNSNAVQKSLMEATELESNELNSLASERYQKAIKMDSNNTLAKQMYAGFLERINK
jgi:hypothetical protein